MKKLLAILLALSAVALLPSCGGKVRKNEAYTYVKEDFKCFYSSGDDQTFIVVNGEKIDKSISGSVKNGQTSLDNAISLMRVSDGGNQVFYILNGSELTEFEGSDAWTSAILSSAGGGIAYTVGNKEESTLYLYNVGEKQTAQVVTEAQLTCTAISPDGKSLTYITRGDNPTAYFYDGEKTVTLVGDAYPFGLSNGGEYIFTVAKNEDNTSIISLYNNSGERVREIGAVGNGQPLFNADHTQLLYYYDENSYISVNGEAGKLFFADSDLVPILPDDTRSESYDAVADYPVGSFYDLFYQSGSGIYQIKEKSDESLLLASGVSDRVILSKDASRIYYLNEDKKLQMVMTAWGKDGPDKAVTLADNVNYYAATSDFKRVYYVSGNSLYGANGQNGKSKAKIYDGVAGLIVGKGDVPYFAGLDGNLHYVSGKSSSALVLAGIETTYTGYLDYFYVISDGAVYCTTGSETPEKLLTLN